MVLFLQDSGMVFTGCCGSNNTVYAIPLCISADFCAIYMKIDN